ncbi:MAG: succinate dehydrogenase, hydrophobic membrane anchor protein [Betaproteobacteria bacterium]|nr:succinate dehydrogenase, hydrophobic membrane anchor protein [Betaproteobacteria bacterium]
MTGLGAWLVQRASAVYSLVFIVFVLVHFLVDPPTSYVAWHDWVSGRGVSIAASVFWIALLAHAWVGLRDVLMDYVHSIAIRFAMLALLSACLAGMGAWTIRILLMAHR